MPALRTPAPPASDTLANRLRRGAPSAADRQLLQRAEVIRDGLAAGVTGRELGATLKLSPAWVSEFSRSAEYEVACTHLRGVARKRAEAAIEEALRDAHNDFSALTPKAVEYVHSCLAPGDGFDHGRAMWATQLILKGGGLLEPRGGSGTPSIQINIAHVHAELLAMHKDDHESERLAATIDVESSPVAEAGAASTALPSLLPAPGAPA